MNTKYSVIVTAVFLALAGCSEPSRTEVAALPEPTVQEPTAPQDVASGSNGEVLALPMGEGKNEPLALGASQSAVGEASVVKAGEVFAIDVQVGNFAGTSDGSLSVRLCSDEVCSEGVGDLLSSSDNSMFTIPLDKPLSVAQGGNLTYEFTKHDGEVPVVIWTYPVGPGGENEIQYKDDQALRRSPMMALRYAN